MPQSQTAALLSIILFHKTCFNKRSGAVAMSPDAEGLGATVEAGVGSNLTQPNGIYDIEGLICKKKHDLGWY